MSRRLLAAMSGWGKSYHAQAIMEASIPAFTYVPILDFKDEYRGLVKAGLVSHFIVGPKELKWSSGTWRKFLEENPKVALARHRLTPEQWQQVAARVTTAARRLAQEPDSDGSLAVIDEAHFVAPQQGSVPSAIEGLATTGRGEGASSLWITQRLAKLEKTVTSQCDETLAGGFTSPPDRRALAPEYPEEVHDPEAATVSGLPSALEGDDGPVPLRKFKDDAGNTVGSEWIYSNNSGERERRDTRKMSMDTTHYGPEGNPIQDPTY